MCCSVLSAIWLKASQLPCEITGLKNGFQGHVTSHFRGQGSGSPVSPFLSNIEDKAHIESRYWKLRGSESVFQGLVTCCQRSSAVQQKKTSVCFLYEQRATIHSFRNQCCLKVGLQSHKVTVYNLKSTMCTILI